MARHFRRKLPIATGLVVLMVAGLAQAQPDHESSKPARGPKYANLRFEEDFSYLGEPADHTGDLWDPIKHIRLNDDWYVSIGGEFRFRWESETNKSFGSVDPTTDNFTIHRWLLHADFHYRDRFRLFVQGIGAFDEDRDLAPRAIDENRWDVQQLFFDVNLGDDRAWTLRTGRQELLYGNERMVSPLDWANTRRRFDGVKLFTQGALWDVAMWWVRPVPVQRKQRDRFSEDFDFYGLYTTYKGIKNHGLDLYFLGIDDDGNPRNANFKVGDRDIYTLGARFWGKTATWDYETELAGQWGNWAGDTAQAWAWTIDGGYTFADVASRPRLGAGFDLATGDDNPFDSSVGTFDQLFPLGHKYFGFLDLIGRRNVNAANVNVSAWPVAKKLRAAAAFHTFWLNEKDDAVFAADGSAGRRDVTGRSGREIGHELDLTLLWKLDVHSSVLVGYSHFWVQDVIVNTGPSEDADLFYVQYKYTF